MRQALLLCAVAAVVGTEARAHENKYLLVAYDSSYEDVARAEGYFYSYQKSVGYGW